MRLKKNVVNIMLPSYLNCFIIYVECKETIKINLGSISLIIRLKVNQYNKILN